jgi:N-acetylglucosaminyldiphosphoundecaprenol N-acetyl-beta-D-mannosaminyltransferase
MHVTKQGSRTPDAGRGRALILGCAIDRVDMDEAIARCDELIRGGGFGQHMAVNAAKLVAMQDDERLREITRRCELVTADGQSVVWASRILGDPLPVRVAGIDLMERLFAHAEERGYRVFVLGARREVLERAVERIRERHPRLELAGHRDGYFDDAERDAVAREIRAARPDILFVAMSSPRKEYFLGDLGPGLGVPFAMGVGGAIDVIAGAARRAPRVLQLLGLEWLFRLAQEPRRLLRRYLATNGRFIWLVLRRMADRTR